MADPALGPIYGYSPEPLPEDPNAPNQSFEPAGPPPPPLPPAGPPPPPNYTPALTIPTGPTPEEKARYARAVMTGVAPLGAVAGQAGNRALAGVSEEKAASLLPHTEEEKRAFAKKVLAGIGKGASPVAGAAIHKAFMGKKDEAPAAGAAHPDELAPPPKQVGAIDNAEAAGIDLTAYRQDYPKIQSVTTKGGWVDTRAPQVKAEEETQQTQGHAAGATIFDAREQARLKTEEDLRKSIADTEQRANEQADAFKRLQAEASAQQHVAQTAHEAAEKYGSVSAGWASKSTPWRMAAGIFAGLGAFGAALTHTPNYALEVINKSIDDEVQAQRLRYEAAKDKANAQDTIYGHVMGRLNNEVQASQVTRAILADKARALSDLAAQREQGAANKEQQQKLDMLLEQQKVNDLKEAYRNMPGSTRYTDPRTGAPITAKEVFELANSTDKTNLALAETIMKRAAERGGKDETNKQLQYGTTELLRNPGFVGTGAAKKLQRDLEQNGGSGTGYVGTTMYAHSPRLFSLLYGKEAATTQQDAATLERFVRNELGSNSTLSPGEKQAYEMEMGKGPEALQHVAQQLQERQDSRIRMIQSTMTDPEARRRFQEATGGGGGQAVPPGFSK